MKTNNYQDFTFDSDENNSTDSYNNRNHQYKLHDDFYYTVQELYNSLKTQLYDSMYHGCFLAKMTFGDFYDFMYNSNSNQSLVSDKIPKHIHHFINSHSCAFNIVLKLLHVKNLTKFKYFVYKYSDVNCICCSFQF